jgi:hypothetical protein
VTMLEPHAGWAVCALAIVAAGSTACAGFSAYPASPGSGGGALQITTSCQVGHISFNRDGHSTFTSGEPAGANFYLVTFTNKDPSRTVHVNDVGIAFYDASGAKTGSDAPSFRTISIAPRHAVPVLFYGPASGFSMIGKPAPGSWVPDSHMPTGATRCQVYTRTVGSTS